MKKYTESEVRSKVGVLGLPQPVIDALVAFSKVVASYVIDWLIGLLGPIPAPTPATQAAHGLLTSAKSCDDFCCCACVSAASGIISMHGSNYDDAMQQFLMAACCAAKAGDPNCTTPTK